MSQLGALKSALSSYARSTEKQAAGLDPIVRSCQHSAQQITALIGGSAQHKEAEVQSAINQASGEVRKAAEALRRAAQIANNYASSL
ncbi:MAG: hypothetical protein QOD69_1798 [Solirubrobacteraceae bacterium]|jgi:hypothetical protein|nr:hypothetical protein [Solirubrobacteraceae bacterium]